MNKPTDEQIKEFWEWCGQFKECGHCNGTGHIYTFGGAIYGDCKNCDGRGYLCPELDLNNLFKYAVDWEELETIQFSKGDDGYHCWIYTKKLIGKPFHGNGLTEEGALFWAIYEVMK